MESPVSAARSLSLDANVLSANLLEWKTASVRISESVGRKRPQRQRPTNRPQTEGGNRRLLYIRQQDLFRCPESLRLCFVPSFSASVLFFPFVRIPPLFNGRILDCMVGDISREGSKMARKIIETTKVFDALFTARERKKGRKEGKIFPSFFLSLLFHPLDDKRSRSAEGVVAASSRSQESFFFLLSFSFSTESRLASVETKCVRTRNVSAKCFEKVTLQISLFSIFGRSIASLVRSTDHVQFRGSVSVFDADGVSVSMLHYRALLPSSSPLPFHLSLFEYICLFSSPFTCAS